MNTVTAAATAANLERANGVFISHTYHLKYR
jgi:hypothetical protein